MDAAFLAIEGEHNPMHIGATALFEPGSFIDERGRVDRARYMRHVELALHRLPKWRLKVARVPWLRRAVLVGDPDFDPARHVRWIHLERGTLRDVERIAGNFYSRMLRRDRPLWEIVIVDGLENRRFAVIIKLHHCMADGVVGLGSLIAMLAPAPDASIPNPPPAPPAEPPDPRELLSAELRLRAREPRALWKAARDALRQPDSLRNAARAAASGLASATRASIRSAPATTLNPRRIGSRRAYRGVRLDLETLKRVRREANAKLNDVVLALVAGALARHFAASEVSRTVPDLACMVPVSLHRAGSDDRFGNEVSLMIVRLPVRQMPMRERLECVAERARESKQTGQSNAFALGEELAEWTLAPLVPWSVRLVTAMRPFNVIVTNVPGPPCPFYLGDAKLVGIYPLVPLHVNQALAIAIVSYAGSLYVGLNADPDHVRDLDGLAEAVSAAFTELRDAYAPAAGAGSRASSPRGT